MLLIPNALCWSSRKCNCACALPAEVQLRLRVTHRSWQKLFAGKNFVKILVTAQTQLCSYSEQQRAFGNSNICNCSCQKKLIGWKVLGVWFPQSTEHTCFSPLSLPSFSAFFFLFHTFPRPTPESGKVWAKHVGDYLLCDEVALKMIAPSVELIMS